MAFFQNLVDHTILFLYLYLLVSWIRYNLMIPGVGSHLLIILLFQVLGTIRFAKSVEMK